MSSTPRKPSSQRRRDESRFPVVGIGASSGGLEALTRFLSGVPLDSGMAFVVVQHLEPERESLLSELLQQHTTMPVQQVGDGMRLEPDRVYVIPPDRDLMVRQGVLHLLEPAQPRGQRLPIDFFFRLLAEDRLSRAVAVILSGTGSDGTLGAQAIKAKSGLVVAQEPASASYPGMPTSVIDTCLVDIVTRPEEMAVAILAALQRARQKRSRPDLALSDRSGSALKQILLLLSKYTGHDFSLYKKNTLYRRIDRRMGLCRIARVSDYLHHLQQTPREAEVLLKELLISVTRFFRDSEVWDEVRTSLFPALLAAHPEGAALRAWVPGCASGEEAYTLAMCFYEALDELKPSAPYSLQIFATDLDQHAIARARKGVYPPSIAADVGAARLRRFFLADVQGYRVGKEIREMVIFAPHNLLADPPFGKLDLLTCRNLLIYLAPEVHETLLARFHYSMNPDAYLVLGSSESIGTATHLFKPMAGHLQLYQRLNTPLQERRLDFPARSAPVQLVAQANPRVDAMKPGNTLNLQSLSDRFLLQHYAPVAILTAESGDILHFGGRTDDYLELAQGKAHLNILLMAREGLRPALNDAFHDALRLNETVSVSCDRPGGGQPALEIIVHPLPDDELPRALMVVFRPLPASLPLPQSDPESRSERQSKRLQLLEQALQHAREEIQATREEMQTSREELTSTNEELQSTNEELTTSAEELRTMNEELVRARAAAELTLARYADLFDSAPVGYFTVDRSGTIQQANLTAAGLLGMERERLAGSRLVMFVSEADRPVFLDCVEQTFATGNGQLCEVALWQEALAPRQVRVSTLIAQDGESCRLAVMDITERKQAEAALRASEEQFRTLWETTTDVVLVLDENSRIQYVNPAVRRVFGFEAADIMGQDLSVLQPERLREGHRKGLERYLRTGQRQLDWRVTQTIGLHAQGHEFPIEISFSHIHLEGKSLFAGFIRDITVRKSFELRETVQARTMTLIATGTALPLVLDAIVRGVESVHPAMLCSILLLEEEGARLRTGAAPSLPDFYNEAIDGAAIGPVEGSCGTAAYFGRRVIVEDIANDPLWINYRALAHRAGLAACWSEPIRSASGRVLGTFAIYHRRVHAPGESDIETIAAAARLAAVAIERHQSEEQLRRMRQLLEASQALAHIGAYEADPVKGTMLWSNEMYRIHDTSPEEFNPTFASAMQFFTPESRDMIMAAKARVESEGVTTDMELELITARGRRVSVELKGDVVLHEGGYKIVGTMQDITERKHAAAAVRASEERLRLALMATHQGLFDLDVQTGKATVDAEYARMLGYEHASFDESLGNWIARLHPDDREPTLTLYRDYVAGKRPEYRAEFRQLTRSGEWVWTLSVAAIVERTPDGQPLRMLGTHVNINERKQAEEKVQLSALVYEHSSEAMMVCDADNVIIAINPAFTQLTGYTEDDVLGRDPRLLASGRHDRQFFQHMWQALNEHGHWQGELWSRRRDGEIFAQALRINTIRNAQGAVSRYVALFSDITAKKESDALIWQQANFDALTHLPNRRMFRDRLEQEVRKSHRDGLPLAVLFIDLDRFKEVNDTLGHDMGDILLIEAARRIQRCVRESDTVARFGGDEFTVTVGDLDDPGCIDLIAQNIIEALSAPFMLGKEQAFVSASIGITLYPEDATEIDDLLKHADQALYVAKDAGRNRFSYFTPALQTAALERMRLTNDLRVALEHGQFQLYFQPVVDMDTGRICKAEALLRWQHPQRGLINPAEFVPLAEASGLVIDLGEWVFRKAASWLKRWYAERHGEFQISINQSPLEFQREGRRHAGWLAHLEELGLPGQCLVVEITEGLLLDATATVTDKLLQLRDAGIQVALDDFGTGYCSLSYLKKFDIDYLKIDQSFIRNLAPGSSDMALCEAIIVMAHTLGLKVIAEGVETPEQMELLREAGCDLGQGFLFARPVPAEAFEAMLCSGQALI